MTDHLGRAVSAATTGSFISHLVGSSVHYVALQPLHCRETECAQLVLHLHGAMSSAQSLEAFKADYDEAWRSGIFPAALVVCATVPTIGGFYMDFTDGPKWETMLSEELPKALSAIHGRLKLAGVIGASMGGYGALKIALRQPERHLAVAALCPTVFPGETAESIHSRYLPSVLKDLNDSMGSDTSTYRLNNLSSLARANAAHLRDGETKIYFDCGDRDEFQLHDGAVHLNRSLNALRIPHTFRSISGAGHADKMPERMQAAIRFVGQAMAAAI